MPRKTKIGHEKVGSMGQENDGDPYPSLFNLHQFFLPPFLSENCLF